MVRLPLSKFLCWPPSRRVFYRSRRHAYCPCFQFSWRILPEVRRRRPVWSASGSLPTHSPVTGFSFVFIALGVALGAAGALVSTASIVASNRGWLTRVGGAFAFIFLGLYRLGVISIPWLDRDRRLFPDKLPAGQLTSSFLVGMTFAAGWSPCVGPILGAIFNDGRRARQHRPSRVAPSHVLSRSAVPFLAAALAFGSAPRIIRALNQRLPVLNGVSGGVMVALGAIMTLGMYQQFFARLVAMSPWTPWEPVL